MSSYIIKIAATQGIWTVLSVFLILYVLKEQSVRDNNQDIRDRQYRKIISSLVNRNKKLNNIEEEILSISKRINDSTDQNKIL